MFLSMKKKGELSYICEITMFERNCYEVPMKEEDLLKVFTSQLKNQEEKEVKSDSILKTIQFLLKYKVINLEEGKIFLKEKVFGRDFM
jgi:hypothetical protein